MKRSIRAIVFSSTLLLLLILTPVMPVFAVTTPAEINKYFTPVAIVSGGTSRLRVEIYNPNQNELTQATFTDNMPVGMTIASPLYFDTDCGAGTITDGSGGALDVGDTSFRLNNGTVPPEVILTPGQCYVEVDVTSTTPGNLINNILDDGLSAYTIDPDAAPGDPPVLIHNSDPASATLNVIAVASPSLTKTFSDNTIFVGETTRLTLTIRNNDASNPLTMVTVTDTLPTAGDGDVILADPVNATLTNCGASAALTDGSGGALDPGDTALRLIDGEIDDSTNCVIEVDVTSLVQGAYTNTIPAGPAGPGNPNPIQTREGVTNTSPASAPLNVQAFTLTKAFATSPIAVGQTSQVTISIQNHAGFDYTGAALDDVLPAGLEYVDGTQATTCTSGFPGASVSVVTTTNTDDTLRLTNGTIPANSTCTITADARALMDTDAGTYTNTIPAGDLQTTQNATNHAPASDDLDVRGLSVFKAFWLATEPTPPASLPWTPAAVTVAAGQTANVTIWLSNPSPTPFTITTGASPNGLDDILPTSPNTNLQFTGAPTTDCVGGTVSIITTTNPNDTVHLSGGVIPGGSIASPGLCKIVAQVTTDPSDPAANNYVNNIPADRVETVEGGTNDTASNNTTLNISQITLAKTFLPNSISYPNATRLQITVRNPATGGALTGITVTDSLPAGLEVAPFPPSPAPTSTCGAGWAFDDGGGGSLDPGDTTIRLTGGTLGAGFSQCTITVYVRPTASASSGVYTNNLPPGSVTTAEGPRNSNNVNTNLTVNTLGVAKAFQYSAFQAGGTDVLTITLTNSTGADLHVNAISDTLPTSPNSNLYFVAGSAATSCAGGGVVSLTGGPPPRTVALTSGALTIPANGSCTITATVTTDASAPAADYTGANSNTIPANTVTTTEGPRNTTAATASVSVYRETTGVTGTKAFNPATINPGQNSRLRLTFTAPPDTAPAGLTNFSFIDDLPTGVRVSNSTPPSYSGCGTLGGAWPPAVDATTIAASGGTIIHGTPCTIDVYVTSDTGSGPGIVYTNEIEPGDISNDQIRTLPGPISAGLTVETVSTLTMDKEFYPSTVAPNGLSTLTITLENSSSYDLTIVSLEDIMPGTLANGVVIAPDPNESTNCTGGVITFPNSQTISMTGGVIPAQVGGVNGICTIHVDVQGTSTNGASPATHTNDIPTTSVTAEIDDGTGSTMNPQANASDDLVVRNLGLEVVKRFFPTLVHGGAVSEMRITLRNPNPTAELTGIQFTDTMPAITYPTGDMLLADPPNFDPSDCGPSATLTGTAGTNTFSFSGGYLAPGDECIITLDATMIVNGNRTNTIPVGAVTSFNGASNQTATSVSLSNVAGASISKDFDPNPVPAGLDNYSILTITIRTTQTVAITNMGLIDDLVAIQPGLEVADYAPAGVPDPITTCGGTLVANPGATTIQLTGGSLPVGFQSCQLTIPVTGANPGVYRNRIPSGALTSNEGITNDEATQDDLTLTPYSLGNRLWFDTDNDGVWDNAGPTPEVGVLGVRVELYRDNGTTPGVYDAGDTYITFDNTNASGLYRFDNLGSGEYVVVIPADNFRDIGAGDTVPGNPLEGYLSSGSSIASDGSLGDSIGPDADAVVTDSDDNGVTTFSGGAVDYVSAQTVTLGPGSSEPTGETDPTTNPEAGEAVDNQSNRTVDFGFYRQELGNLVFVDNDVDGAFGAGDVGLPNAQVQLYAGNGVTEIPVGADGILGTADDGPGGMLTDATGNYQFSGLPAGAYVVKVRAPIAYSSTVDTANPGDTTTPNNNIDDNDNGVGEAGGQVASNSFTLTPGVSGTSTTVDNSTGTTANPSLDFGYTIQPYSLGNRVWFDTDNDGLWDSAGPTPEIGVPGVRVELYLDDGATPGVYDAGDTFVAFQPTSADGYYRFDNLSPTDYVVVIPADNFRDTGAGDTVPGNPLEGYLSSGAAITLGGIVSDGIGPDVDTLPTDSDDNGVTTFSGMAVDYVSSQAVTLGPGSSEPTGETDALPNPDAGEAQDDQSNRTVDFGFYRQQVGNLVFVDLNGDGLYTGGADNLMPNAVVQLFTGDGATEIQVGPDGILGTSDDAPGGMLTDASGAYQFSGLPQGQYVIRATPTGGNSTVDTGNPSDTAAPNNNIDNNDNGVGQGSGQASSSAFNLTPGVPGTSTTVDNNTATTTNPSLDFGFTSQYSLGNRVWFDTDNDNIWDSGTEVGVTGVRVELFRDNGATPGVYDVGDTFLSFQTTDADGLYRFDSLDADTYVVVIPDDNFRNVGAGDSVPGNPLAGYLSSGTTIAANGVASDGFDPDPDGTPTDSDDNGSTTFSGNAVDFVASRAVTLGPGASEPTGETDPAANPLPGEAPDGQSNRTVDFGFYRLRLGNLVFQDIDENGVYDAAAGDLPLSGARVLLFASDGVTEIPVGPDGILGTADDATGGVVTGAGGTYQFSGLPEGDYIVTVQPTGYPSTVDTANAADTANPNTNADNNDNGVGAAGGDVSSNAVALAPGDAGALGNNQVDNATGTTYNPTVDFGYVTSLAKAIIPPDDATHTTLPDVTIGEIVTYQVSFAVPVGGLTGVQLVDTPQAGLAFVDCVSITLPAGVTSTEFVSGACDTLDGVDPAASNPLIQNNGGLVTFDFGDVGNTSGSSQTVQVRYSLIVLDILANGDGDSLTNSVTWNWTGGSRTTSAPVVEIIEPIMTISMDATPNTAAIGDVITFTINISHAAISTADAFDAIAHNPIPPGLTFDPASLVVAGTATLTSSSYDAATNTLHFNWDEFGLGDSAIITYQAVFNGPAPVVNAANVEWTSHPINALLPGPPPVPEQRSPYNTDATERWYDPADPAGVNSYNVSASVAINAPGGAQAELPATGFAPGRVTVLPEQPLDYKYAQYGDLWLEIPKLGVKTSIVGVPRLDSGWDVQWLWDQAGWLQGTAFPTWEGNSVLTGHVVLPDGQTGPFVDLGKLRWGDQVIIHAYGQRFTYEVRTNHIIKPNAISPFKHEEKAWLTLLTCVGYEESSNTYKNRIETRAVLIKVESE
ncbi:MAG: sortase [Chloroflexota bacterium]